MHQSQFIERRSGRVVSEHLLADRWINFLYTDVREKAPTLFKAVTSSRASSLLGSLCFDGLKGKNPRKTYELMHAWGIDVSELLAEPQELDTPLKLFTRQIRYWECRPMEDAPAWVKALFGKWPFIFTGAGKKVSYEGGLEGRPVIPIQAITSLALGLLGFVSLFLFLQGFFSPALWLSCLGSAFWRIYSETLRADFRGNARITAYQKMILFAAFFAASMPFCFPSPNLPQPVLAGGLTTLWAPGVLLALQALWVIILAKAGLSRVTASTIEFHVLKNKI